MACGRSKELGFLRILRTSVVRPALPTATPYPFPAPTGCRSIAGGFEPVEHGGQVRRLENRNPTPFGRPPRRSVVEFLDSSPPGPRSAPTWDEIEQQFSEERDAWKN